MTFGCKVNNSIRIILRQIAFPDPSAIQYIYFFKKIIGCIFNIPQIFQVAGIGQCIEIDDLVIRIFSNK